MGVGCVQRKHRPHISLLSEWVGRLAKGEREAWGLQISPEHVGSTQGACVLSTCLSPEWQVTPSLQAT